MHSPFSVSALLVFVSGAVFAPVDHCAAEESAGTAGWKVAQVRKIWDAAPHNAFTDLLRWRDAWWCVFREADAHVGGDGKIRVLTSRDGASWESAALVAESGIDLRDPKVSAMPDGRLMLTAGGSVYQGGSKLLGRQPRVAFSPDGRRWSEPKRVLGENDWLWRVTWHEGMAYGVSYKTTAPEGTPQDTGEWSATLYHSRDGIDWQILAPLAVPGRPNETTLRFAHNGEALALVRRESADRQGWLGRAQKPWREWNWAPIGRAIGGPNLLVLTDGRIVAAGRDYRPDGAVTAVDFLRENTWAAGLKLPSGGDTSYPGLVEHEGAVWMSYYASQEGKSAIYLARLEIPPDAREARPAKNDADLRLWLESMAWHHRYSPAEMAAVLGLNEAEIPRQLERFAIRPDNIPARAADAPLLVLPYPGGRHPRMGFLDGAVNPQRETKLSVFAPWQGGGYVVLDVPEAVFSNLGLIYLAHTHVPTVWDAQGVKLPRLEWQRRDDGAFTIQRNLPNGVAFGVEAVPHRDHVGMKMWLKNGTASALTGLRVQMCAMLKEAAGFGPQANDNKQFSPPFSACRDATGRRWIIHAWRPSQRCWGNAPCPCLHADPQIPDCPPGESREVSGWLSFYEGDDVQAELRRIGEAWK